MENKYIELKTTTNKELYQILRKKFKELNIKTNNFHFRDISFLFTELERVFIRVENNSVLLFTSCERMKTLQEISVKQFLEE